MENTAVTYIPSCICRKIIWIKFQLESLVISQSLLKILEKYCFARPRYRGWKGSFNIQLLITC